MILAERPPVAKREPRAFGELEYRDGKDGEWKPTGSLVTSSRDVVGEARQYYRWTPLYAEASDER